MAAKVTMHETPSDELVREARREVEVKDQRGRTITLTKPAPLAQFRLVRVLGDAAANQTYVRMILPLLFVTAIDGEAVLFPQSEREIEALITRLDDDGLTTVMTEVQDKFGAADQEAAAAEVKG